MGLLINWLKDGYQRCSNMNSKCISQSMIQAIQLIYLYSKADIQDGSITPERYVNWFGTSERGILPPPSMGNTILLNHSFGTTDNSKLLCDI